MKIFTLLTITIALAAPLLAQTPTPSPNVAEAFAKQELNEAAAAYRERKFAEAQAHSERALLLDPQNKSAPFFIARTIHAQITEQPGIKVTTVKGNKAYVRYRMPKERVEFERAKECANRGLELANMAIILTPDNESAWASKTNVLLELAKLAEMSGEVQLKLEFQRQYDEALRVTTKLSKRSLPPPDSQPEGDWK